MGANIVTAIIDRDKNYIIQGRYEFQRDATLEEGILIPPHGTAFPTAPNAGEWFIRTDESKLYRRNDANTIWVDYGGAPQWQDVGGGLIKPTTDGNGIMLFHTDGVQYVAFRRTSGNASITVGGTDARALYLNQKILQIQLSGLTAAQYFAISDDGDSSILQVRADHTVDLNGTLNGVRHYPNSATNPTTPTPAEGDRYWNNVLHEEMRYDSARGKWLSVASFTVQAGCNGRTLNGGFYRGINGMVFDAATRGIPIPESTLVYWAIQLATGNSTVEALHLADVIAHIAHTGNFTEYTTVNADFKAGHLAFRNALSGAITSGVQITATFKRRVG